MQNIEVSPDKNIYDLISLIESSAEPELTFLFKKGGEIYKNSANLQILKRIAEENGRKLKFESEDPQHKDYIEAINNDYVEYSEETVDLDSQVKKSGPSFKFFGRKRAPKMSEEEEVYGVDSSSVKKRSFKGVFVALFLFLIIGSAAFAAFWFLPTAKIKLFLDSEVLVKLLDIKAVVDGSAEAPESGMPAIKALSLEVTETDSQTIPTTGKSETGEKATGEITFFNKTNKDIEIKKNTTVILISTSEESLQYVTRNDAKISAQTETTDESGNRGTQYGTGTVKVEAKAFGEKYNQGDGQKFEIKEYDTDELVGENRDDISGGTFREINIVAQDDHDNLRRTLEEFMKTKVISSLNRRVVQGQVLPESSVEYLVTLAKFSNQVGEEAENLTLEITMTGKGLAYTQSELDDLVKSEVERLIPEGNELNGEVPEYEVATVKSNQTPGVLDLQVKVRSYITPKLDEAKIKSDLKGASLDEAQEYIQNLKNVKSFEIELSPPLPGPLQVLPLVENNITLEIER